MVSSVVTDWGLYAPYFKRSEFECSHTGKCEMDKEFMDQLLDLRVKFNKPMIINSGYRHWTHPIEAKKGHKNGDHVQGRCADIGVAYADSFELLRLAINMGFERIGVNQKGSGRFLHLGLGSDTLPTPALWSY
tara:strand:+ start:44082 stop:44480 length:399 start_codon:yes stop_codon:yes gene_type:complete